MRSACEDKGPFDSYHKFKYAIVFLDDATSHAWTINLRSKDAAITATKRFLAMVKNKYKTTIGKWMSDAGGEYKSNTFIKMLKDEGIEILQSIPHTHQQNGRAECIIRTLMEKGESMRLEACLPQSWWEFSLEHATHVYNRTPIRRLSWQTPHEQLNREKPTVDHLRIFSCGAYVYIPAEVRSNKLAPKSELMTYLGNTPRRKRLAIHVHPQQHHFYLRAHHFRRDLVSKMPPHCQVTQHQSVNART